LRSSVLSMKGTGGPDNTKGSALYHAGGGPNRDVNISRTNIKKEALRKESSGNLAENDG
jgi:hypothetical protein